MYKKIRYSLRFLQALLAKYYLVLLSIVTLAAIAFVLLPRLMSLLPRIRPTHHIAVVSPASLSDLPLFIQKQISLGLTLVDEKGLPQPSLARQWDITDGGKTYTFTLDTSRRWQDGTPVNSHDIKYNFKDAQLEYPDNEHFVIRLPDPFAPLPTVVSRPVFKAASGFHLFNSNPYIGTGEYRIKSYRKNGSQLDTLTLEPMSRDISLPVLQYHFYNTDNQARTAYKLGLVNQLEINDPGELAGWPNLIIESQPQYDRNVAVFFNTQDPFLAESAGRNLRLGLAYAIDKSRWPNRAFGPLPPTSWAYNPDIKKYDYDIERAQALIKKVEKLPDPLVISTVPAYLNVAEAVKEDWSKVGINSTIQVNPDIPQNFQVLVIAQAIPADPDQYNLWHSRKEDTNLTHLKNPRIDKLLEDGRKLASQSDRLTVYQDFQKFLTDEVPAIFLFYPDHYHLVRK